MDTSIDVYKYVLNKKITERITSFSLQRFDSLIADEEVFRERVSVPSFKDARNKTRAAP
jgi:hypothetical protein